MGRWRATAPLLLRQIAREISSSNPSCYCLPKRFLFSSPPKKSVYPFIFRTFSAISSRVSVYGSETESGSHGLALNYSLEDQEDEDFGKIPVRAYFLSTRKFHGASVDRLDFCKCLKSCLRKPLIVMDTHIRITHQIHGFGSIDVKKMQAENLSNVVPPTSRSTNYIALRYCDFPSDFTMHGVKELVNWRYMVVFQYGSVVLFNIEDHEVESYLEVVRRHASGVLAEMRKDDYAIKEKPFLAEDMQGGPDYIVLKTLDTDSIRIIGSVLGQSIALDYFVSQVDGMVEEFAGINRAMEKTGTFTMDRKKLLQLVGKANSNLADVILKVGLFERSEIAWRDAKYAQIYEYLREEYEVTQRFGNLDFKLKFVEHNIHFLQEVIQNRRSDLLEWCIIFLLSVENVISIYEIVQDSGMT